MKTTRWETGLKSTPVPMGGRVKVLLVTLILALVVLGSNEALITAEAHGRPRVRITTAPETFPDYSLGQAFDFDVTVFNRGRTGVEVFLTLSAECPLHGVVTLSGDASGDSCEELIETSSKVIEGKHSGTWELTVVYTGSIGTYEWTIKALTFDDDDDDEDEWWWWWWRRLWQGG